MLNFIVSGLFGAEITDKNETLVTAANAIFVENGEKKAPAAVVGFQFQHSALHNLFINITSSVCSYFVVP